MSQRATRIKSVQHAKFFWRSQYGTMRSTKPKTPTVNGGTPVSELIPECQERAMLQLDRWTPVVCLYLLSRVIRYEGDRALSIWKTYNAGLFGKKTSQ